MNNLDLLSMSLRNLWVRKLRTFLTLLGVVIGTTSIIVMISLGLGMKKMQQESIERMGSLSTLQVMSDQYGGYEMAMFAPASAKEKTGTQKKVYLNDAAVERFKQIPGVKAVAPERSGRLGTIKIGKYELGAQLVGVPKNYFEDFGIEVTDGELPSHSNRNRPAILLPSNFADSLYEASSFGYSEPDFSTVDPTKSRIKMELTDYDAMTGKPKVEKSWNFRYSGTYKNTSYMSTAYILIEDYEYLQTNYEKAEKEMHQRNAVLSGNEGQSSENQSTTKNRDIYDQIKVKVSDLRAVEQVKAELEDMGYGVSSMLELVNEMNKSMSVVQAVLAGIGSVALLVAAIGITNTMVMSIYERTKEIGIMKVIGASVKNIRRMFLAEAALIGLLGGSFGVLLSKALSLLINRLAEQSMSEQMMGMTEGPVQISYIPAWLILLAVLFSGIIGLLAGYAPAKRATKLSAIEAIRTE